ncbi:MAG: 4Fe-4S dicluster domain-containing protein [Candidatus Binataceae bacterium]
MKAAILTDTTKCIGCNQCVIACKQVNHLAPDSPRWWDLDDGLSARNWTSIVDGPKRTFVRKQCRHCLEPACVSACPVGALSKTALGPVVYDSAKCMGCRYCMMACPYGVPRYTWDQPVPYVRKCILCYDRVLKGGQPACTEACPTKATVFGDRDALLAEAHRRIDRDPALYANRVWGEHEVGGASVLYISNVDLSFLAPRIPTAGTPLPDLTALAMDAVPFAFTGVVAVMAGLGWIIGRRMKRQSEGPDEQG